MTGESHACSPVQDDTGRRCARRSRHLHSVETSCRRRPGDASSPRASKPRQRGIDHERRRSQKFGAPGQQEQPGRQSAHHQVVLSAPSWWCSRTTRFCTRWSSAADAPRRAAAEQPSDSATLCGDLQAARRRVSCRAFAMPIPAPTTSSGLARRASAGTSSMARRAAWRSPKRSKPTAASVPGHRARRARARSACARNSRFFLGDALPHPRAAGLGSAAV